MLADAPGGLEPVDAGHVHVERGDVGIVGAHRVDTVVTVVDGDDVEPGAREHLHEQITHVRIVVDDDGGLACGLSHRDSLCCA